MRPEKPSSYERVRAGVLPLRPRANGHANAWREQLLGGDRGPYATVSNAVLILGCDPDLAGIVAYDEFAHRIIITRSPPLAWEGAALLPGPYPRPVSDTDITLIQGYMQRTHSLRIGQPIAQQSVVADAESRRMHPVRQWLDKLVWDGKPRLETWLHVAFGTPLDAYHKAVAVKTLCGAVRRVRRPGCKFDHVLVLEGHQGSGKSRACAALFGQDWFTDNLSHDLANKDAQQGMAGKWGIELAELNVLVRSTNQAAKAFFSRQVDYYRPPYGKSFVERPRQCVFIGTTNDNNYLTDTTGNRRYWPVVCARAEVAWIGEVRDQLWAEAAAREADGETLWLDDDGVQTRATREQAARMPEETWTEVVRDWIAAPIPARVIVRGTDVLHEALGLPRAQQNKQAEMRVGAILRAEGWHNHRFRGPDGKTVTRWFAPGQELPGKPGVFVASVIT